jgi:predicted DNA-binding ribbon-helix-helix protein
MMRRKRKVLLAVRGEIMQTAVIKRSIVLDGHKTSVSLENEFWHGLREIAGRENTALSILVGKIDRERNSCNLSSAIRVYVFNYFRAQIGRQENSREITAGHLDADVSLAARREMAS